MGDPAIRLTPFRSLGGGGVRLDGFASKSASDESVRDEVLAIQTEQESLKKQVHAGQSRLLRVSAGLRVEG